MLSILIQVVVVLISGKVQETIRKGFVYDLLVHLAVYRSLVGRRPKNNIRKVMVKRQAHSDSNDTLMWIITSSQRGYRNRMLKSSSLIFWVSFLVHCCS